MIKPKPTTAKALNELVAGKKGEGAKPKEVEIPTEQPIAENLQDVGEKIGKIITMESLR